MRVAFSYGAPFRLLMRTFFVNLARAILRLLVVQLGKMGYTDKVIGEDKMAGRFDRKPILT